MLTQLLDFLNQKQLLLRFNNRVALIVNNLGGLTQIEMNVVVKEVLQQLQQKNVTVERVYHGCIMTSFNMKGVSLSVMLLEDDLVQLLDQSHEQNPFGIRHTVNQDYIYRFGRSNISEGVKEIESNFNFPPALYSAMLLNACQQIVNMTFIFQLISIIYSFVYKISCR